MQQIRNIGQKVVDILSPKSIAIDTLFTTKTDIINNYYDTINNKSNDDRKKLHTKFNKDLNKINSELDKSYVQIKTYNNEQLLKYLEIIKEKENENQRKYIESYNSLTLKINESKESIINNTRRTINWFSMSRDNKHIKFIEQSLNYEFFFNRRNRLKMIQQDYINKIYDNIFFLINKEIINKYTNNKDLDEYKLSITNENAITTSSLSNDIDGLISEITTLTDQKTAEITTNYGSLSNNDKLLRMIDDYSEYDNLYEKKNKLSSKKDKYSARFNEICTLIEEKRASLPKSAPNENTSTTNTSFIPVVSLKSNHKYLKYKTKYLELRNSTY